MRAFWRLLAVATVAVAALLATVPAGAESLIAEFEKAQPVLGRQLRSREIDQRLEAIKKLSEYPLPEAVRLVHGCYVDEEASVRQAAYAALLSINNEQPACDTLVELVETGVRNRDDAAVVPALAVLLSSSLPRAQRDAQRLLEKSIAKLKTGRDIALAVADGLAAHHEPVDVMPLLRLSKTSLYADNFAVQRAVIAALVKIPTKEAIGALIGMLDSAGGEARADGCRHLAQATGQIFGLDAGAWQRWWSEASATFVYSSPKLTVRYLAANEPASESGYYYGLPLFAEKLVFVLDTSGSMSGGRILAAKRELIKAVSGLPDHVSFGIVVFNGSVASWQSKLVKADAKAKKAAITYIEHQAVQSHTASYDALEAALTFDTEAIYFLSDGAPTAGKILAPVDIINTITAVNTKRRISIYTIGIAPGFPGSETDAFLSTLAEKNSGQYRRVDQ